MQKAVGHRHPPRDGRPLTTSSCLAPHSSPPQEEDISALEDAIRNRLAGRRGASGKAERLAAKKSLFSRDEWSQVGSCATLPHACMAGWRSRPAASLAGVSTCALRPPAPQISLYVAFMAREDEKRAAAASRATKREVKEQLQGQAAQAAQRKWVAGRGGG